MRSLKNCSPSTLKISAPLLVGLVISRNDPNDKLFYTQKGGSEGFSANTLVQFFHVLYRKAGIDGASSHSGRRSFCTNLAAQGVGIRVLMAASGHKSLSAVQRYLDVNTDMLRKAIELA